jgi:ribosomal protein S18 acetylase RimI-like enzyme
MANYIHKVWLVLCAAAAQWRRDGALAALVFLLSHVYSRSITVLYESHEKQIYVDLPPELEVILVSAVDPSAYHRIIEEAGVGSDAFNFRRGAVGWLILAQGAAVAIGWAFKSCPIFRSLGYDEASTLYLGGFHVRAQYRGRGLYPYLLQRMFVETPAATCAVAETACDNLSSQQGLLKAGFTRRGIVDRLVVCGCTVRCRLVELERREGCIAAVT